MITLHVEIEALDFGLLLTLITVLIIGAIWILKTPVNEDAVPHVEVNWDKIDRPKDSLENS